MKPADYEALKRDNLVLVQEFDNGEGVGLYRFLITLAAVLVEVDYAKKTGRGDLGYRRRFCYPREYLGDALAAAETWDGSGDPPGRWVKEKSRQVDRLNPALMDPRFD